MSCDKIYKKVRPLPYEKTYVIFAPKPEKNPIPLGLRPEVQEDKYCLFVKLMSCDEAGAVEYGFEVYNMTMDEKLMENFCRIAGEYLASLGYVEPYRG